MGSIRVEWPWHPLCFDLRPPSLCLSKGRQSLEQTLAGWLTSAFVLPTPCSDSTCGWTIVNSYQLDAFLTLDLPLPVTSGFQRNLNVTSGSGMLWAYFEEIYERNPRVFSNSGSKVYWWVSFNQALNLPPGYIEIKVVGFFWISSHFTQWVYWEQSEK